MLKTLPYNALRTLEAVVRLRGFGRAATELNVSQSAVSQHIRQLEDWLGVRLLNRRSRQTLPTEAGERLARATRDGFGLVESLCADLRGTAKSGSKGIVVGSPPGFAFLWLLPRLLHFDDANPDVPVSLSTDPQSRDPELGEADVFITYSTGGFPGLHAEQLMTERMSPVCAPALVESLKSPGDLAAHTILQDDLETADAASNWDFWAKECGISLPAFPHTRTYGQANMVVQAAVQGLGIAMGRGPLVADAIADGRLVYPFPNFAQSQFSYWFVCTHEALSSKPVGAFRKWLHDEAGAFAKSLRGS
ncbi:LysR substrate-binding domain-containing protein [Sulfitobacter sp. JB4-11]|uniref:LysR substrate-binding domain-containing protein n=1 Tax=Sulfitobacter rhodophyticola TaxID=3238304 RepID=UPI003D8130C2